MRISDWSSDVCSSDLPPAPGPGRGSVVQREPGRGGTRALTRACTARRCGDFGRSDLRQHTPFRGGAGGSMLAQIATRSEENKYELQPIMRNSYAVFGLQKIITHSNFTIQQKHL